MFQGKVVFGLIISFIAIVVIYDWYVLRKNKQKPNHNLSLTGPTKNDKSISKNKTVFKTFDNKIYTRNTCL